MSSHAWKIAAVAGAALLWSTSFAVTKVVLPYVGEVNLGAIRFLAAALLLALVCWWRAQSLRASAREHASVALAGLVGITAYFTLENYGVALATATDATLIVASYPVLTMLAESVVNRRRPAWLNLFGVAVAVVGVSIVVSEKVETVAPHRGWGIILLLLGGIAWTAYNMLSVRSNGSAHQLAVMPTTLLQNFWGGIGFVMLVPLLPQQHSMSLDGYAILLVLYLAVGCSAIAFLLYTFGLTGLSPGQAVGILNLVPVFGVLWAVTIAGEQLTLMKVIGAAIIVAGVALSTARPNGPKPTEQVPPPIQKSTHHSSRR